MLAASYRPPPPSYFNGFYHSETLKKGVSIPLKTNAFVLSKRNGEQSNYFIFRYEPLAPPPPQRWMSPPIDIQEWNTTYSFTLHLWPIHPVEGAVKSVFCGGGVVGRELSEYHGSYVVNLVAASGIHIILLRYNVSVYKDIILSTLDSHYGISKTIRLTRTP